VFDSIYQLLHRLYDVQGLIQGGGIFLVCLIVFVETGLFIGFFLPGDSLLVTAGVFAAAGLLSLPILLPLVVVCAIAGDQVGYWIGQRAGEALYRRKESFWFKRRHLDQAHAFYEKYGGKAVVFARFVPIARTFCPVVAGAARMRYSSFLLYNIVGGVGWGAGLILAGYFLASIVPNIGERIHLVIVVVVALSFLPPVIGALRARSARNSARSLAPGESPDS
jgi:membrane-associated protein